MTSFDLGEKRALITGGSKGIGLGIAKGLVEAGAEVVLVARDEEGLASARSEIGDLGGVAETYSYDVSKVDGIPEFFGNVTEKTGDIDILINSAGMTLRRPAEDIEISEWNRIIAVNLSATFGFCQAFARERIALKKGGKIVNIASLMSEGSRATTAAYCATKGGIRQLTKALAVDWAPYGINVNAIGPGFIKTPLTEALWTDETFTGWVKQRTPLGRWGAPEDLAGAAVFLASPASDFVTGQTLYVDGGWLAGI